MEQPEVYSNKRSFPLRVSRTNCFLQKSRLEEIKHPAGNLLDFDPGGGGNMVLRNVGELHSTI
jgi:hypothetical protein